MKFGIEAASFFVPTLYLEIKDLAEKRGIEPAKLEKGLGFSAWRRAKHYITIRCATGMCANCWKSHCARMYM
jgi:hypothetical protein